MSVDPHWNNVVLAMHMDGADNGTTFTDVKGKTVTANGNAVTKTAVKKFGTASAYFDGTGDYLTVPNSADLDFGSGDFTIEMWVYLAAQSSLNPGSARQAVLVSKSVGDYNASMTNYTFGINGDATTTGTNLYAAGFNNGTVWGTVAPASPLPVPMQQWSHISFCRSGNTLYFAVNGNVSSTTLSVAVNGTGNALRVGASAYSMWENYLNGYIDDLRITKGIARYTSNFTPPTETFPDWTSQISGTVKDDTGTGAVRTVVAFPRSTPTTNVVSTTSAADGTFTLNCNSTADHCVICLDDDSGANYNALVFDRVTPA